MPDYDLGRAHGKVVIDSDTRGAARADATLLSLKKSVDRLDATLKRFEGVLRSVEAQLAAVAAQARATDDALEDLDGGFVAVGKSSRGASKGLQGFNGDLSDTYHQAMRVHQIMSKVIPRLRDANVLNNARRNGGGIRNYVRAGVKTAAFATGVGLLTDRITGMDRVMRDMPSWQKQVISFASKVTAAGAAFAFLNKNGSALGGWIKNIGAVSTALGSFKSRFDKIVDLSASANPILKKIGQSFYRIEANGHLASSALRSLWRNSDGAVQSLAKLAGGTIGVFKGIGLMRQGLAQATGPFKFFFDLMKRNPKFAATFISGIALFKPALELGALALKGFSNGLVFTANAVKTLAGGFPLLIGGLSTMIGLGATLKVALGGLSDAFSLVSASEEDFASGIKDAPKSVQSLITALHSLKKPFEQVQENIRGALFQGWDKQVEKLGAGILPSLEKGMTGVAAKFNKAGNSIMGFLGRGDVLSDMQRSFTLSGRIFDNLAKAIVPVLSGLKDIALVGQQALADLTAGAGRAGEQFAAWAKSGRDTGKFMAWIKDAVQGARDLASGLKDAFQGIWKILTAFATTDGEDALGKFADQMERFNNAVGKSKADGFLGKIAESVKGMGTDRLSGLVDMVKRVMTLKDAISSLMQSLDEISQSFLTVFIKSLEIMTPLIEGIVDALGNFAPIIGVVLGLAAAFKVLVAIMKPILGIGKALAGAFIAFKSGGAILAAAAALEKFGAAGRIAASGILAVGIAAEAVMGILLGLIAAVGALVIAFVAMDSLDDNFKSMEKNLNDAKAQFKEFKAALHDAFVADGSLTGKNVFGTITTQISTMRAQLEKNADEMPGIMQHIGDFFSTSFAGAFGSEGWVKQQESDSFLGESKKINDLQAQAQAAELAQKKFEQLGITNEGLAAIVTSGAASFTKQVDAIKASGEGGEQAAAQLEILRQEYVQTQAEFAAAGPANTALASAVESIGDAGVSAANKLDGLRRALEALGIIQTSALDAAFAYAESIREIGDAATDFVDHNAPLDDILNETGNGYNTNSKNAARLREELKSLADGFLDNVSAGKNAQETYDKLAPAFENLSNQFKLTIPQIQQLAALDGALPDVVDILVNIKGGDKVDADIRAIIAKLQTAGNSANITIPISGDPALLQQALDNLFGPNSTLVTEDTVSIRPGLDPVKIQAAIDQFKSKPPIVPVEPALPGQPGGPPAPTQPPKDAAPIPVPVQPLPPGVGRQPNEAGYNGPAPAAAPEPAPPPAPVEPVNKAALEEANAKIAELEGKLKSIQETPIAPKVDPAALTQISDISTKLTDLQTQLGNFTAKDIKFKIIAEGVDETVFVLQQQIPQAIQTCVSAAQKLAMAFVQQFGQITQSAQTMANQINSIFSGLVSTASGQGSAFATAFAGGLMSAAAIAYQAAETMAKGIKQRFHNSPPKKGPLSDHGDAARWAGGLYVKSYAAGMTDASGQATGAAEKMGSGVYSATKGPYDLGKLLGMVNDFISIGSKLADIFADVADQIFEAAKFMSDPLGKGTFFGKSPGAAFGYKKQQLTDEQLAQKLIDKVNSAPKAETEEQKKQREQSEADAKKQQEITSALLDEVVAGRRVAPISEEEKKADKEAASEKKKNSDTEAKSTEIKAKSDQEFARTAQEQAANLSAALDKLTPEELAKIQSGEVSIKNDEQMLAELAKQTPLLQEAIDLNKKTDPGEQESIRALNNIDAIMSAQGEAKTPAQKQQMQALEGLQSSIMSNAGLEVNQNPIDQAQQIAGNVANFAQDIFKTVESVMQSVGAAKNLGDIFVRGVENSEDVMKIIDNIQQFIETAAQVASTVASGLNIASTIASAAGGADPSGGASGAATGLAAASQIASMISAALSTVNAIIDISQEVYRIAGKYVGEFLGFLTGGMGGQLMGDVRFLLDENDGTLKTWSRDNPEDKRSFDNPFQPGGINEQQPQIGQINVYGGPGQDPRDMANEMMFAVAAAGSGAGNYN